MKLATRSGISMLLLMSSWGAQAAYTITDLGSLGGSDTSTFATAINASGQVVGHSSSSSVGTQAFIYSNGTMQSLGALAGGSVSHASDINASGQVVGWSTSAQGTQAFVYSGGVMSGLGTLGGYTSSQARGINDSGQVVGYSSIFSPDYLAQAFIYSDGVMRTLPALGSVPYSTANAINNAGQIVGIVGPNGVALPFVLANGLLQSPSFGLARSGDTFAVNELGQAVGYVEAPYGSFGYRAFVYSNGVTQNLGTLSSRPSDSSYAYGVNNLGQVVGQSNSRQGDRPFIYTGGTMYDLALMVTNASGWVLTEARDINDSGQIIGNGLLNGVSRAFLLTPDSVAPVPLPESLGLMFAGLGTMALAIRRRSQSVS